jgi:trk system potassium uptake protein TrkA
MAAKSCSEQMNYVIIGCGRVGSRLATLLTHDGHDVTVVDENPAAFKRLGHHFPGRVEVGTGIDYDVLRRAGVESADGFIAVTDGDNRNVMAALIAQRMFGIKKIVARIYDPPRGEMYRELGIETVCPTTLGAQIIRDKLTYAPFETVPAFDFGAVSSLTVRIGPEQAGLRISELDSDGRIRIAALRRAGAAVSVPSGDDVLAAGDEINAIVAPEALAQFAERFAASAPIRLSA